LVISLHIHERFNQFALIDANKFPGFPLKIPNPNIRKHLQGRPKAAFCESRATRHPTHSAGLAIQKTDQPVPLAEQVAVIYAGTQGYTDKVPVARVKEWEAAFVRFMRSERPGVLEAIEKQKALDDTLFARLKAATSTFNHQFGVEGYNETPDPAPAVEVSSPPTRPASDLPASGEVKKPKATRKKAAK